MSDKIVSLRREFIELDQLKDGIESFIYSHCEKFEIPVSSVIGVLEVVKAKLLIDQEIL